MPDRGAPKSVIRRLPVYVRILDNMIRNDIEIISSRELSEVTGFTAEQIRKDLAYFGAFGTRGTGYNTSVLREKILEIIGLNEQTNIIVVGSGHLGIALARHNIRKNPYVNVVAIFDIDPEIIGGEILGVKIMPLSKLPEVVAEYRAKVAILTVPAAHAQNAVEPIIKSGISVIFNLTTAKLEVPGHIHVHNVDLSIELQSLIYYATHEKEEA